MPRNAPIKITRPAVPNKPVPDFWPIAFKARLAKKLEIIATTHVITQIAARPVKKGIIAPMSPEVKASGFGVMFGSDAQSPFHPG